MRRKRPKYACKYAHKLEYALKILDTCAFCGFSGAEIVPVVSARSPKQEIVVHNMSPFVSEMKEQIEKPTIADFCQDLT